MNDQLADLAGRFHDGYDSDDIRRVFEQIRAHTGVRLLCVWDYFDDFGYGGNSEFYVQTSDGTIHQLGGQLWPWLWGGCEEAPEGPGSPDSWIGSPAPLNIGDLDGDGLGNAAVENRT